MLPGKPEVVSKGGLSAIEKLSSLDSGTSQSNPLTAKTRCLFRQTFYAFTVSFYYFQALLLLISPTCLSGRLRQIHAAICPGRLS